MQQAWGIVVKMDFVNEVFHLALYALWLTNWDQVMHMYSSAIIGSDNDVLPVGCQAIIWTNDVLLLNGNKFQWNLKQNATVFHSTKCPSYWWLQNNRYLVALSMC